MGEKITSILIVYDSKTGNTEKMAQVIAKGAKEAGATAVKMQRVEKTAVQDLLDADGIIIGSPAYFGQMTAQLKQLIDDSVKVYCKLAGKVGAAFTNSGGTATGAETTLFSILQAMLIHGMIIQGNSEDKHYGAAAVGKLKPADLKTCEELGARVVNLVNKLKT
jgi:NAD(P)H dehydrogenase (quinone)